MIKNEIKKFSIKKLKKSINNYKQKEKGKKKKKKKLAKKYCTALKSFTTVFILVRNSLTIILLRLLIASADCYVLVFAMPILSSG